MGRAVSAVFYNKQLMTNFDRNINIPSSAWGSMVAAKIACNDYAWDNGFSHYAFYDTVSMEWQVFECKGRSSRIFLTRMPTKAAAEMWLVHRG